MASIVGFDDEVVRVLREGEPEADDLDVLRVALEQRSRTVDWSAGAQLSGFRYRHHNEGDPHELLLVPGMVEETGRVPASSVWAAASYGKVGSNHWGLGYPGARMLGQASVVSLEETPRQRSGQPASVAVRSGSLRAGRTDGVTQAPLAAMVSASSRSSWGSAPHASLLELPYARFERPGLVRA
jgi:hypothetical protein